MIFGYGKVKDYIARINYLEEVINEKRSYTRELEDRLDKAIEYKENFKLIQMKNEGMKELLDVYKELVDILIIYKMGNDSSSDSTVEMLLHKIRNKLNDINLE